MISVAAIPCEVLAFTSHLPKIEVAWFHLEHGVVCFGSVLFTTIFPIISTCKNLQKYGNKCWPMLWQIQNLEVCLASKQLIRVAYTAAATVVLVEATA